MTLKSVLRALQQVFPQIDLRILRAVAVEYSEDVDAAIESNAHSEPQSSVVMLVGNCSNVLGKNETKLEEEVSVPQSFAVKCDVLDADVQELGKTKLDGTMSASSDNCPTLSFQTVQDNLDLMECGTQIEKAMSSCMNEHEEQLLGAFKDVARPQDK
ncbi:hypothetical protein BHM03_00022993 [Ensete ventricosum]|nr:hypothetical protein BHM03_00022993 [Ensete ventricosum]